jgi:hypothetical protein
VNLDVAALRKKMSSALDKLRPSARAAKMLEEDRLREKAIENQEVPEPETGEAFCKRYGVKLNYNFLRDDIGPRIDRYCNKKHAYLHFKRHSSVSQLLKHMDYQEEVQKRNIKYERRLRIEKLKKLAEEKKKERE